MEVEHVWGGLLVMVLLLVARIFVVLSNTGRTMSPSPAQHRPLRTLIVLGSGGSPSSFVSVLLPKVSKLGLGRTRQSCKNAHSQLRAQAYVYDCINSSRSVKILAIQPKGCFWNHCSYHVELVLSLIATV